jgi:hypothetical protein
MMKQKTREALDFLLARLSEPSTWQGIGFIAGMFGSRFAGMDWGQAAGLGGLISAVIKMFTADSK